MQTQDVLLVKLNLGNLSNAFWSKEEFFLWQVLWSTFLGAIWVNAKVLGKRVTGWEREEQVTTLMLYYCYFKSTAGMLMV